METLRRFGRNVNLNLNKKELRCVVVRLEDTSWNKFKTDSSAIDIKQEFHCKEELNLDWDERDNIYDNENEADHYEFPNVKHENLKQTKDTVDSKSSLQKYSHTDENDKNIQEDSGEENETPGKTKPLKLYKKYCRMCKREDVWKYREDYCTECRVRLIHECKMCNKQFPSFAKIQYHLHRICNFNGYYYRCPECILKSRYRIAVAKHIKNIHPKLQSYVLQRVKSNHEDQSKSNLQKCSLCEKQFERYAHLVTHQKFCNKVNFTTEQLPRDDFQINNDSQSRSIFTSSHLSIKKKSVFYCVKCEIETAVIRSTKKYTCHVCQSVLLFKCLKCSKHCKTYDGITHHLQSSCDPQRIYKCLKCDYTSYVRKMLNKHYRRMHNPQYYECKKCSKIYNNPSSLSKHMKFLCDLKYSFHCDHCSFHSKSKLMLRNHIMQQHDARKTVECSKCNKIFKNKINLKGHLRICENPPQLECCHCHFTTKYKRKLQRHISFCTNRITTIVTK